MQSNRLKKPAWNKISCSSSGDRYFHSSTLFKDYIITYGGRSEKTNEKFNDIKVLNLKTSQWQSFRLEGTQPITRSRHSACLYDTNKIIIYGGYNNNILKQTSIITIQSTDPLVLRYEDIETTGGDNFRRCSHTADIYNNQMYVFGGRCQEDPWAASNQLWALNLKTFTWRECETNGDVPDTRTTHCSAVYGNKLFIFGGYSEYRECKINTMAFLNFDTMRWESFEPKGVYFEGRYGASVCQFEDKLYIFGGFYGSKGFENDCLAYDFESNTMEQFETNGGHSRIRFAAGVLHKNSFVIWGGKNYGDDSIDDIYMIKLESKYKTNIYEGNEDSFSEHFKFLLFSNQFSDITFSVEGEKIPAHKLILASRCKHFHNIFSSGMIESHSSEIEIIDMKSDAFKALLGFLYKNEVELTETLALELYEVADKYMQNDLLKLCEEFLSKNIRLDNFTMMIDFVEKFEVQCLRDSIYEFIILNLQEIKEKHTEYKVPDVYLWEVLSRISQKTLKR